MITTAILQIEPRSYQSALLSASDLHIIDEAPALHRHCHEAIDRFLRDLMSRVEGAQAWRAEFAFGGKVTILSGDLRQILPVIRHGTEAEVRRFLLSCSLEASADRPIPASQVLAATLNRSDLWHQIEKRHLTTNHRVEQQALRVIPGETDEDRQARVIAIREWGEWVLKVGEGKVDNPVEIPDKIHLPGTDVNKLINHVYPDVASLTNKELLKVRAITALRNDVIDQINRTITERVPGEQKTYSSTDW
jgi:hypothetical protein